MSEILDCPEVRERALRWTVEEYERVSEAGGWAKRTELIRGVVLRSIAKSPLHCALADWLYEKVQAQLPGGFCALFERPIRLADSEPEPDLMVVTGVKADYRRKHATTARLVIEIAISSIALDRGNAALYAEAGVEEYWIVMGREQWIEVYRNPADGVYTDVIAFGRGQILRSDEEMLGVSIDELFDEAG